MTDITVDTFFGRVTVPGGTSFENASALAYIAWKGGTYEDGWLVAFRRWFRRLAERRPDLVEVYVSRMYPVDEFRYRGTYVEHYSS
jgi:hypothetical protein